MNASRTRRFPLVVIPLLLAPLAAAMPSAASAQTILKCAGPDGTTIFTDRSCESFGATLEKDFGFSQSGNAAPGELRDAPATITDHGVVGGGFGINGCARTRGELIAGVRESIARGDVNRLANYYDWNGMGTSAAFATMERLDGIARNTMAAVAYDYPQPSYDYARPVYAAAGARDTTTEEVTTASLSASVAMAAMAYQPASSVGNHYRVENDDVPYSSGIVDAGTLIADARPAVPESAPAPSARGTGSPGTAMLGGTVDASTPLGDAQAMTLAHVSGGGYRGRSPTAMRVNLGGGTGHRLGVREKRGCWFVTF